jgi:hypothetical protein
LGTFKRHVAYADTNERENALIASHVLGAFPPSNVINHSTGKPYGQLYAAHSQSEREFSARVRKSETVALCNNIAATCH